MPAASQREAQDAPLQYSVPVWCVQYDGQVINDESWLASCRYRCSVFGSTVAGKGQKQEEVWDTLGRRAVHTVLYSTVLLYYSIPY